MPVRRTLSLASCVLALANGELVAQSRARTAPRPRPAPAPVCTDTLTGARWRVTPLSAMVTTPDSGERDRDRYVDGLLRRFEEGYRDPNGGLQTGPAMVVMATEEQRTAVRGELELLLDRSGRVLGATMTTATGIAMLDSAIVRAARGADRCRGYGRMPRKLEGDTVRFLIAIADRDLPATAMSLGGISSSYLEANIPPRIRNMPPARAPRGRRGREVVLAGTVDRTGRVIPSTVRLVSTNDSSLIAISQQSFEATTYWPGSFNGCPAEATIRLPFKY